MPEPSELASPELRFETHDMRSQELDTLIGILATGMDGGLFQSASAQRLIGQFVASGVTELAKTSNIPTRTVAVRMAPASVDQAQRLVEASGEMTASNVTHTRRDVYEAIMSHGRAQ